MDRVTARLLELDPAFGPVVEANGPMQLRAPADDPFQALLRAIVFQQLAGKAANAIHGRVIALFDGAPSPEAMLGVSQQRLREAGLSAAKQAAVVDLARKFSDGTVPSHDLDSLSDDEVIARLTQIRGIGRWTAEMFLLFQLRRPDVWPIDDLGVRNGWKIVHAVENAPTPKELASLGDPFRPNRTLTAWYCWRAVAPVLIA
ncbi:MAG: DNA-3-methyladenine glycosylase 2 family protein [Candidatus Dormibacteraeota bacterium]|nr:DNA-3-methyladenine glycosylase 2 family protein [Candidatus Dormibacteraeota bacterium]